MHKGNPSLAFRLIFCPAAYSGAAGPTGNGYGDAPGHTCIALSGPVEEALTIETGEADRSANMRAFAAAALEMLKRAVE